MDVDEMGVNQKKNPACEYRLPVKASISLHIYKILINVFLDARQTDGPLGSEKYRLWCAVIWVSILVTEAFFYVLSSAVLQQTKICTGTWSLKAANNYTMINIYLRFWKIIGMQQMFQNRIKILQWRKHKMKIMYNTQLWKSDKQMKTTKTLNKWKQQKPISLK